MEILNYALRESLLKQEKTRKRHKEKGCCDFSGNPEKKALYWTKIMNHHMIFKIFLVILILLIAFAWNHNSQFWSMPNFHSRKGKF